MEPRTLLIVDDEVMLLTTLQTFFEGRGFRVWAVTSGEAALPIVAQHRPALVLLDMCLGAGRLHGFDVLRHIKTQSPDSLVLMWSGSADADTKAEAVRLGADRFFDKPVNLAELLRVVQTVNGRSQP